MQSSKIKHPKINKQALGLTRKGSGPAKGLSQSPAELPAVAPGTFVQVQTRMGGEKEKQKSHQQCVFIPREGKETLYKPEGRIKRGHRDQERRVRESVTHGEGVSTPHVHRTRWDPRLLCLSKDV